MVREVTNSYREKMLDTPVERNLRFSTERYNARTGTLSSSLYATTDLLQDVLVIEKNTPFLRKSIEKVLTIVKANLPNKTVRKYKESTRKLYKNGKKRNRMLFFLKLVLFIFNGYFKTGKWD